MQPTERNRLPVHQDPERLREEILYLELRLQQIGHDGDCAYEKAMIRFFQEQVAARREKLACTLPPYPG